MKQIKQETGRSMVEMLGVLAVIGVLSVGGISGYAQAMTVKYAPQEECKEILARNWDNATRILYACAEGAQLIAEDVKENTTFTELRLRGDKLDAEGGKVLFEALKGNKTLTTLGLSYNNIGDEGGKAIVEALKENTTLTLLDLEGNNIDDKIINEICESLAFNLALNSVREGFFQRLGFCQMIDAQDRDLSKAQLKALIQLQKEIPNFKFLLSKEDMAKKRKLVLEERKKEIKRLKEENQKIQDETNQNKENAGENQPKNFNAKKKSLGNGKGLTDKLQAKQQAKERAAKVARAKGKGQNA